MEINVTNLSNIAKKSAIKSEQIHKKRNEEIQFVKI